MKKITVEITYDHPLYPDEFSQLNAETIWNALQEAFHLTRGVDWTVQELDVQSDGYNELGPKAGGK